MKMFLPTILAEFTNIFYKYLTAQPISQLKICNIQHIKKLLHTLILGKNERIPFTAFPSKINNDIHCISKTSL